MKILSLVLFLVSVKAFACPNFTGNYTCQDQSGSWDMSLTQTEENGVTVYHQTAQDSEGTFIADGVARPYTVNNEGEVINGTLSTTCADPTVTIQFLGDYKGSEIDFTETMNLSDGALQVTDTTKMNKEVVNSATYECKLKN